MKKLKQIALAIAGFLLLIFIAGCKKGDTGPAGQNGADGLNGINGANGTNGNANVHSRNFTITSWNGVNTSIVYKDLTDPDVTQSIIDSGAVMVYQEISSSWYALPRGNYLAEQWSFNFYLNHLVIQLSHSDFTTVPNPGTFTFKVVVMAGSNRLTNPNLNWNNYEEVKQAFNLKD